MDQRSTSAGSVRTHLGLIFVRDVVDGGVDHAFAADLPGFLHNRRFTAKRRRFRLRLCSLTCTFTVGSSSPLRGVATGSVLGSGWQGQSSSSPLRGVATGNRNGCFRNRCGPHRPYEGSQRQQVPRLLGSGGSPHRPYEGSQRDLTPAQAAGLAVLIAPTRGRNKRGTELLAEARRSSSPLRGVATGKPGRQGQQGNRVLIAPTRGRNA